MNESNNPETREDSIENKIIQERGRKFENLKIMRRTERQLNLAQ